jgi:drug/metabolite transporter (DMT)-like permease
MIRFRVRRGVTVIPAIATSATKGATIILFAALCAGIGNAITGLTAHEYLSSGSIFPAIDIALANTLGGLAFVGFTILVRLAAFGRPTLSGDGESSSRLLSLFRKKYTLLGGGFKGANTILFVLSTVYIVATQSLIFESTYVIWSLVIGVIMLKRRTSAAPAVLNTFLLFIGIILVSGQTSLSLGTTYSALGATFGLLAGLSFAFYLYPWSLLTRNLESFQSKLAATGLLLTISTITIGFLSEVLSFALLGKVWTPFVSLKFSDTVLQFFNGALVIGVVYLLVTIGMRTLRDTREGSNFVAAICLSFMIPFTLLTELAIGKFLPSALQLIGVSIFIVGFILISASLSETRQDAPVQES